MSSTYYLNQTHSGEKAKSCILEPKTIGHSHDQINTTGVINLDSKSVHANKGRTKLLRGIGDSYVINADLRNCHPSFETIPITQDPSKRGIGMAYCVRRVSDAPPKSKPSKVFDCKSYQINTPSSVLESNKNASIMYGSGGYDLTAANVPYLTNRTSPYGPTSMRVGTDPFVNPYEYPSGSDPGQLPPNYAYNVSRGYISREIDYDGIGIYKSRQLNATPLEKRNMGVNRQDISSISSSRPTYLSSVNASLGDEQGRGRVYDKRSIRGKNTRGYIAPVISKNIHRPHLFEALGQ